MKGPPQHGIGGECALCAAHAKAAERHTQRPDVRRRTYLPWAAPFVMSVLLLPLAAPAERWFLVGIALGVAGAALLAWLTHLTHRHIAAATLASATEELKSEADQRVAMVIRQFEWAVNDVANLRDAQKRAQEGRHAAEANLHRVRRRVRRLERQLYDAREKIGEYSTALGSEIEALEPEPPVVATADELIVPLTWTTFEDNMLTWLRFESAGIVPSQIRIMNAHESVIAISARALDTLEDGAQVSLVVRAPDDVVATLEGRHHGRFTFEALVDDSWCKVELKASRNGASGSTTGSTAEDSETKPQRTWRPSEDRLPQSLIA